MSRNALYVVIALLAVVAVGLGIYFINAETQRPGLEIRLDEQGLTVDGNG